MEQLVWLTDEDYTFPDVGHALVEPNGLLAVGGDLSTERLLSAYGSGIFPWYEEDQPILWWSPDPRTVIEPEGFHVSRSLRRTLNSGRFTVTFDQFFENVIDCCAQTRRDSTGTWITKEIKRAFCTLHEQGIAHSAEIWYQEKLVGGIYGIAMGSVFFGESMFSKIADASKVAMYELIRHLKKSNFSLLDCQVYSDHLASLGAFNMPRGEFIAHLQTQITDVGQSNWIAPQ